MFGRSKKISLTSVIVVESGEVSIALVDFSSQIPNILWNHVEDVKFMHQINSTRLQSHALTSLRRSLSVMEKIGIPKIMKGGYFLDENVHIFLGSPWINHKMMSISYKEKKKFFVTKELIDNCIKNELKNDDKCIESHLIKVKANGYDLISPIGKKVQNIDIVASAGFIDSSFIKSLYEVLDSSFVSKKYTIHSTIKPVAETSLLFSGIKNEILVIVLDHELSDIFISENGSMSALATVPFGINHIMRKFIVGLKKDELTAESIILLQSENKLSKSEKVVIDKITTLAKSEYLDAIHNAIWSLGRAGIPSTAIIFIHGALGQIISNWISNDDYLKNLTINRSLSSRGLNDLDISKLCKSEGKISALLASGVYFLKNVKHL